MKTLAIYCRTSKTKSKEKDQSIPTQKEMGIKFARSIGWNYQVFEDAGKSGADDNIDSRPAFAEMLDLMNKGKIHGIHCIDQSRIERNSRVWNLFVGIVLNTKSKYFVAEREFDLNEPESILFAGLMSLVNEFYAALTSRKVKLANERKTKQKKTHGMTAFGYRRSENGTFEIEDEEAQVVRRIFKESLEGKGTYTIANGLNTDGIKTRYSSKYDGFIEIEEKFTGKKYKHAKKDIKWRGNVVHGIITNPIYKGLRIWNKNDEENRLEVQLDDYIIEPEFWDKVNENLVANAKMVGRKESYHYLLNGLIECVHCGNYVIGKKRLKGTDNAYKCKGKRPPHRDCTESRGISLPKLENFIIKHLFETKELKQLLIEAPKENSKSVSIQEQVEKLQDELKQVRRGKKRLAELLKDPDLTEDDTFRNDYKKLKNSEFELKQNIESLEQQLSLINEASDKEWTKNIIESYVEGIAFDELKVLVHSLIESIELQHLKLEKGGLHLLKIKYRYHDEYSLFTTDYKALEWMWYARSRSQATTPEELETDREDEIELMKFLSKDERFNSEAYSILLSKNIEQLITDGLSVSESSDLSDERNPFSNSYIGQSKSEIYLPSIVLNPDELILFD